MNQCKKKSPHYFFLPWKRKDNEDWKNNLQCKLIGLQERSVKRLRHNPFYTGILKINSHHTFALHPVYLKCNITAGHSVVLERFLHSKVEKHNLFLQVNVTSVWICLLIWGALFHTINLYCPPHDSSSMLVPQNPFLTDHYCLWSFQSVMSLCNWKNKKCCTTYLPLPATHCDWLPRPGSFAPRTHTRLRQVCFDVREQFAGRRGSRWVTASDGTEGPLDPSQPARHLCTTRLLE